VFLTRPPLPPPSSRKKKVVRLACVRHAASVYPEPGSNSPSNVSIQTPLTGRFRIPSVFVSLRSRPSLFVVRTVVRLNTWLFADSFWQPNPPSHQTGGTRDRLPSLIDRKLFVCVSRCVSLVTVAVLLSTLQLLRSLSGVNP
jgi:hypothetical protein